MTSKVFEFEEYFHGHSTISTRIIMPHVIGVVLNLQIEKMQREMEKNIFRSQDKRLSYFDHILSVAS
jgi:hypothetical protein